VVQVVGWTGIVCATVEVLVDNYHVGVLRDRRARSLALDVGVHQVAVKVNCVRSRTLVLSLAPGDRIALECGFRRFVHYGLSLATIAALLAAMVLLFLELRAAMMKVQLLALGLMVVNLLTFGLPGARISLKRSRVYSDAGALPERMDAPILTGRPERDRRGFRLSLRALLILIACCAPVLWVARELWDHRPENQPARALRMLRSGNPGARLSGAEDLRLLLRLNSLTPKQADAAIPPLLAALRDQDPRVRDAAATSLFSIVTNATTRSAAVPRVQAVAVGLAER
jgi:hypothetical protein